MITLKTKNNIIYIKHLKSCKSFRITMRTIVQYIGNTTCVHDSRDYADMAIGTKKTIVTLRVTIDLCNGGNRCVGIYIHNIPTCIIIKCLCLHDACGNRNQRRARNQTIRC